MSGLQKDASVARHSAEVDCAAINSASVCSSTFSSSVMLANMQKSRIMETNGPLDSSMNPKSVITVCGAHAKNAWDRIGNGTSLCSVALSSCFEISCDSPSSAWCFLRVQRTMSHWNSDRFQRNRASFSVSPAIVSIHQSASWSVRIVKRVSSK